MSATTKHTPGPWKVQLLSEAHRGYSSWQTYAVRSEPANVCLAVIGDIDRYESERIPANARLIAAAPDLLEIARRTAEYFADTDAPLGIAARAAIAKAEGGAS